MKKVLLIEDSKVLGAALVGALKVEDIDAHWADNGVAGVQLAKQLKPDLILLDGGIGQVHAVMPVLQAHGLQVPLFGMVKDNKHRTRAIACNGGEIDIQSKRRVFTLISDIQEEVHRFSVAYHHSRHAKRSLALTLTEIDGIGENKAKALLKHFKTLTAIRSASVEELCKAEGIQRKTAEKIYAYYHQEDE